LLNLDWSIDGALAANQTVFVHIQNAQGQIRRPGRWGSESVVMHRLAVGQLVIAFKNADY